MISDTHPPIYSRFEYHAHLELLDVFHKDPHLVGGCLYYSSRLLWVVVIHMQLNSGKGVYPTRSLRDILHRLCHFRLSLPCLIFVFSRLIIQD